VPVFTIQTPEGRKLKIEAADQAAALSGAQHWHSQNAGYAAARAEAEKNIAHEPGSLLGPGADRAIAKGALFGWNDELSGAGAATRTLIGNTIDRALGKAPPYSVKDAYHGTVDAERAADAAFAQQHPLAHGLAEFAPNLALGPEKGAVSALKAAPGLLKQVAAGAGLGGVFGGVSGAGNATEGHRLEGATSGAAVGAVTGAALPAAIHVGAGAASGVGNTAMRVANAASGGKLIDPMQTAVQKVAEALGKDGFGPADIQAKLAAWQASGASEPALMNLGGENTRALVRAAASQGPARNAAVQHAGQVAEDLQDNIIARTRALKPGAPTAADAEAAIKQARGAQADQDYPSFSGFPVPVSPPVVSAVSGATGKGAISEAAKLADALRDPVAGAELGDLGAGKGLTGYVSAGTVDLLRRGLRDSGGVASRAGENTLASGLGDRAGDLESVLMDVPGFDKARSNYREHSAQLEALAHGLKVMGSQMPSSEFAAGLAGASPEAQGAAQTGAIQAITDGFANPAQGSTGALNRVATATAMKEKLGAAFGDDQADTYRQALANELQKVGDARYVSPNTGSQTFHKLEDVGLIDPTKLSPHHMVLSALSNLLKGAGLNDAERGGIVDLGLGAPELSDALTAALLKKRLPNPGMAFVLPAATGAADAQGANQ
jgi:hypothetical protein